MTLGGKLSLGLGIPTALALWVWVKKKTMINLTYNEYYGTNGIRTLADV